MRRIVSLSLVIAFVAGGCALTGGTLGGRQECWSEAEPRIASLMRGRLELDPVRSTLATPEGERLPLRFAGLTVRSDTTGTVVAVDGNGSTVAADGEDVTVFGGLDSDGSMLACAIEERHARQRLRDLSARQPGDGS